MVRFYTIAVDMYNGADAPEETYSYEMVARAKYNKIKLSAKGVVYKSLTMTTDDGEKILARESLEEA